MPEVEEFIDNFLEHRIYDPVKAHEYYEKTKELKGRRPPLRGKKRKEGWAYVQSRVRELKKNEYKGLSEKNKITTKQFHENAKARRDELSAKIKALIASVSGDVKAQIAALPKGLSKEEHKRRVDAIRAQGKEQKDIGRASRDSDRKVIVADLKGSLDNARANYKAAREKVKAKYEGILDSEYQAIKSGAK